MTLDDAPPGRRTVLADVVATRGRRRRLAELGLRAGQPVVPLHRTAGGGRLVDVGGSRLALDRRVLRTLVLIDDQPAAP